MFYMSSMRVDYFDVLGSWIVAPSAYPGAVKLEHHLGQHFWCLFARVRFCFVIFVRFSHVFARFNVLSRTFAFFRYIYLHVAFVSPHFAKRL